MTATPKKMVFGAALGLIGGIIAIAAMAASWNGTVDSMYDVGLNMLIACMFFAVAGSFSRFTPVEGRTILALAAVCEAVVLLGIFYSAFDFVLYLVLAVIGAVNILFAACPTVTSWVDTNRI